MKSEIIKVINDFKTYYSCFSNQDMNALDTFYAESLVFTDPIHQIDQLDNVKDYFVSMCDNLTECRFEFVGETIDDNSAWFKWTMHYRHPRLKNNAPLRLTGASYIKFANTSSGYRITSHEDFYDMGSMLYEHTPVLGRCIRWLKQQLVKSAA
ncbi:MAG: hypothetical protein ACJATV_000244 [Granulosicoccus sp.]|jgi:hypothetical protein